MSSSARVPRLSIGYGERSAPCSRNPRTGCLSSVGSPSERACEPGPRRLPLRADLTYVRWDQMARPRKLSEYHDQAVILRQLQTVDPGHRGDPVRGGHEGGRERREVREAYGPALGKIASFGEVVQSTAHFHRNSRSRSHFRARILVRRVRFVTIWMRSVASCIRRGTLRA
jgi:hypothetical protein